VVLLRDADKWGVAARQEASRVTGRRRTRPLVHQGAERCRAKRFADLFCGRFNGRRVGHVHQERGERLAKLFARAIAVALVANAPEDVESSGKQHFGYAVADARGYLRSRLLSSLSRSSLVLTTRIGLCGRASMLFNQPGRPSRDAAAHHISLSASRATRRGRRWSVVKPYWGVRK